MIDFLNIELMQYRSQNKAKVYKVIEGVKDKFREFISEDTKLEKELRIKH